MWVNFVNVMLDLRLVWLRKVYHKINFFSKKGKNTQINDQSILLFLNINYTLLRSSQGPMS